MVAFLKTLFKRYGEDEVANRAAALSYYTIFSLGPLLFVILGIIGLIIHNNGYHAHLLNQLNHLIGPNATKLLNGVLSSQGLGHKTGLAFWIGGVGLILGAIGIFGQLQQAINAILHVKVGPDAGKKPLIRQKLISLGLVGVVCFLLIVSLVASAAISAFAGHFSGHATGFLFHLLDVVGSLIILGVLLMLIFRTLPPIKIAWRLLFKASLVMALFFTIGKEILGIIIGNNHSISAFGAAGSLIAILLWVFYSGQILYLGAAGLAVHLDKHPENFELRYAGKEGVLRIKRVKEPLQADLPRRAANSFLEGLKEGWRDD